jgi:predicted PurR-regulated permease PerM
MTRPISSPPVDKHDPQPESAPDPWSPLRRLAATAFGLLVFALLVGILIFFRVILQPLFVAVFIGYLILPAYHWLVQRRVPAPAAGIVMLALILAVLFGLGTMVFNSFEAVVRSLPEYEKKADRIIQGVLDSLPFEWEGKDEFHLRDQDFVTALGNRETVIAVVGSFRDFFTGAAITFLYLIFLVAERVSFPRRMALAFGEAEGRHILDVVGVINRTISEYIAVKTFISFLAGVLSLVVLWGFGVDFAVMWSILIFLFNFIPYLGSWVAVALPILLSFVQLDPLRGTVITLLLIGIQVALGNFLEPRMAGRRLGISPLLILLALAFWGLLWGIVGMILAVPLLVVIKTILDNIKDTKPLATLMSNM